MLQSAQSVPTVDVSHSIHIWKSFEGKILYCSIKHKIDPCTVYNQPPNSVSLACHCDFFLRYQSDKLSTLARSLQDEMTYLFTAGLNITNHWLTSLCCSTDNVHQHLGFSMVSTRQASAIAACAHWTSSCLMWQPTDGLLSISSVWWRSKPKPMLEVHWCIKKAHWHQWVILRDWLARW